MQNARGMRLGQYTLDRLLGGGAMGRVYLGNQEALQRQVAIKLMNFADEKSFRRFQQEVAITSTLDHPHIIKIYDYGIENQIPYVVMQYLAGGALSERIRHAQLVGLPPVSLGETAQLVEKIASALDYAHQQGVIHRDIKPGNVMFDVHGYPYLVDFGIARIGEGGQELTQVGMTVGTPFYMAPEMWGPGELTTTIDQYAMGVLLYEMLTGRHPFEVDAGKEPNLNLMYKHLNELPPQIELLRRDLPAQLTPVLRKALAKRPQDRFATMTDFSRAFSDVARMAPGQANDFFRFKLPEKNPADIRIGTDSGLASRIAAIANHSKSGLGNQSQGGFGSRPSQSGSGSGVPMMGGGGQQSTNRAPLIAVAAILAVLVIGGLILLLSGMGGADGGDETATPNSVAQVTDEITLTPIDAETQSIPPTATLSDAVMQLFRDSTQTAVALTNPAPLVETTPTEEITPTDEATASVELTDEATATDEILPSPTLNDFAMQLFGTQTAEANNSAIPEETATEEAISNTNSLPTEITSEATAEETATESSLSPTQEAQTLQAIVEQRLNGNQTATQVAIITATAEQIAIDQTATANIPTATPTMPATNTPKPTRTFTPTATVPASETPSPTYTPSPTPTATANQTEIAATITQTYLDSLPTNTPTITPTPTPDSWSISESTITVRGWVAPQVALSLLFVPMACFTAGDVEQCLPAPFEVDAQLVTNAQYAQCVNGGACFRPVVADLYDPTGERKDEPVVGVTWFMARIYCENRGGRLLTEREWLFIAENNADFGATAREWLGTIAQDYDFAPYNADDGREDISRIVQGAVVTMAIRGGVEDEARFTTRTTLNTNQNDVNLGFRCVQG
ncbi:MAG: protein kinase [bacterium]|nr:protein kinase [bacterium]